MPVDTSFYPKAAPPVNPLEQAGSIMSLMGQMNQNKLFQQNNAARIALGQAYQQSINPITGELDEAKLMTIIGSAGNPASILLPDVRAQATAQRQADIVFKTSQYDLALKKRDKINAVLGSIPGNPGAADLLKAINNAGSNGLLDPAEAAQYSAQINAQDPASVPNFVKQKRLEASDATTRANYLLGQIQMSNLGNRQEARLIVPATGENRLIGEPMMMGPSPDATLPYTLGPTPQQRIQLAQSGAQPVTYTDASGTLTIPTSVAAGTGGYNPFGPGGGASRPPVNPAAGTGLEPNSPAPPIPGIPRVINQPGFKPYGAEEAGKVEQEGAAKTAQQLVDLQDQVPARKSLLQEMLAESKNFTPGPNADWTLFAKKVANSVNPFGNMFDPSKIADQESFEKQAQQLINSQESALGQGTDQKLTATTRANLHQQISRAGIQQIGAQLLGNEDAITAKNKAWQAWRANGNGPGTYNQFTTWFNDNFDPRIYQMKYLEAGEKGQPSERTKFLDSFSKTDKAELLRKAGFLKEMSWYQP